MMFPSDKNQYELMSIIGKGSFSNVYKVRLRASSSNVLLSTSRLIIDSQQQQQYALKIIQKQLILNAGLSERVRNEVQIHSELQSCRNIVKLLHHWEDNDAIYLLMELCQEDLYSYLHTKINSTPVNNAQNRGLDEKEVGLLMKDLVEGVAYLHHRSILHRDLKLSNIMLQKDLISGENICKIGDFGLSCRVSAQTNNKSFKNSINISEAMTMCGTPNYISPEIVNRRIYGLSTDIWSLGCLLYTLLCGYAPFESDNAGNVKETLNKIKSGQFSIPSFLSFNASDLVKRMLTIDPADRITIDEIKTHPFVLSASISSHRPVIVDHFNQNNNNVIDRANTESQPLFAASDLQALSTLRLKPIKQVTKHGVVEITTDGIVMLELTNDKYKLIISSDGLNVQVTDKSNGSTFQYQFSSLPSKFIKKYKYAFKFVQAVRSKTPKVIYYSQVAKSMLMENNPPDFECVFCNSSNSKSSINQNDQVKIRFNASTNEVEIAQNGKKQSFADQAEAIPFQYQYYYRHMKECYQICLDLIMNKGTGADYPLIIRGDGKNKFSSNLSSSTIMANFGRSRNDKMTLNLGAPTLDNSLISHMQKTSLSPVDQNHIEQRNILPQNGVQHTNINSLQQSAMIPSLTNSNQLSQPVLSMNPSRQLPAQQQSHQSQQFNASCKTQAMLSGDSNTWNNAVFMANVGWCVQTKSGSGGNNFTMLFNDGVRLTVETPSRKGEPCYVAFTSSSQVDLKQGGAEQRLVLDRNLPRQIKSKLVHFTQFVKLFKKD
ncbi:hypothetical protein MIR68_011639 [Amoeboaphelidium protococcarum]|nr:hypothetical protein MIR68_011639 [Amoeboaphelidium protococcarum]